MTTCHHCGQDMPQAHEWKGLRVSSSHDVYWCGVKQPHFTKTEAGMLLVLAKRGEATQLSIQMLSRSVRAVDAHICHIRKKLKAAGIPVGIETIYGFGYRLVELAGA